MANMQTETALVSTRCPNPTCNRPMVQRANNGSGWTKEQAFCGAWWDCPHCRTTILFPSKELTAQLNEQRGNLAVEAAKKNHWIREGFEAWLSNACYYDGKGYRMKADKRRRAVWSQDVTKAYPSCQDFHEAAHAWHGALYARS